MVVQVAFLVLSIGLSLLAGYLLQKKNKSLVQDDKPTTLATRGSYLPLVKGRHRVGPIFGWAGGRRTTKEKAPGGKGSSLGGSPSQTIFREDGWHQLCIGPAFCLWEIEQNGVPIFVGPITADSHPSGSTIDLGNEGSFRIFWGENDQPQNTYLGDASRVGVSSRWPRCCYVEWRGKRMGPSPNWPQMTYVVETRPQEISGPILTGTPGYIEPTQVLSSETFAINAVVTGSPGTAYWELLGDQTARFKPKGKIQVTGNTGLGTDTDFTLLKVVFTGSPTVRTRLFTNETIPGAATADGDVKPYDSQGDDGWNGAHALAELLFEQWPFGLSLDKSEWNMTSLEALGSLIDENGENLRCSLIAPNGQDARGLLGGIMQDLGVMISLNMRTGLLEFVPVRKPTGTIPHIPFDAQVQRTEIEVQLGSRPVDRLVFAFSDEENAFRDMTIAVDDDGQASQAEFYRARSVQIISTSNFDTAARISQRRALEELAGGGEFRIFANRAARVLIPGEAITADGFNEVLRVMQTKHDPLSGQVEVVVVNDFYGGTISSFLTNRANTGGTGQAVEADEQFAVVEVPEVLTGAGGPQTVLFAHVRAHAGVSSHDLHISRDDVTYAIAVSGDLSIITGGTLDEALDDAWEQDQGPEFTALGPDIGDVLDLTSDVVSWRNGRQLVVFVDGSGNQEIAFLKKITFVAGTTWRLDGLIRARYDTRPLSLGAGTRFFILQNDDGEPIQDPLLAPQVTLYGKSQPRGQGVLPLPQITPESVQLYGKGIRPVPVSGVKLDTGSNSAGSGNTRWGDLFYRTTGVGSEDDLVLTWAYSTPQTAGTGAGLFGAGATVFDADPEGDFIVEILDSMSTVKRTVVVSTNSYTYTRADRIADFGSEPSSFKVRVTQLRGGQQADPVTETFSKTN